MKLRPSRVLLALLLGGLAAPARAASPVPVIVASGLRIELGATPGALWSFAPTSAAPGHAFAPPVFPLDGRAVTALPERFEAAGDPVPLGPDVLEYRFRGTLREDPSLALELRFRLSDLSPIVRFQYRLTATKPHAFSRSGAVDEIEYLATSLEGLPRAREIRLSEFVELLHSYTLSERPVDPDDFEAGLGVMGPILVASDGRRTMLLAYEHGSQAPDAFLRFDLGRRRSVSLRGVKGNYWRGQVVDADHPYETVWLQAGLVAGDEDAAAEAYRRFVREELSANAETRAPRVHYNTWNFQERNKWWNGKRYLDSMNAERMLAEIDVAARMGIETFVLDTGWYEKTGDWAVSRARFPEGLAPLKAKLDAHGMKLGLWFNPNAAAVSSRVGAENAAFRMSWKGESKAWPVWETEESYPMCLVSPWGEAFLKELVRLHRETGVTYYKWDAVGQYGCDAPGHGHGTAANTPEERADAYAFRIGLRLAEIAERLGEQVPGAVVDFDVTEGGRAVGLAFLTAGRYFLVNNGPYYQNYDVPIDPQKDNWNLFFHKGAGAHLDHPLDLRLRQVDPVRALPDPLLPGRPRGLAARQRRFPDPRPRRHLGRPPVGLPRGRRAHRANSWACGGRCATRWPSRLPCAPDRSAAAARCTRRSSTRPGGARSSSSRPPRGRQRYVSEHPVVEPFWATPGTTVTLDASGHAIVDAAFAKPGAAIVFFGAREGGR